MNNALNEIFNFLSDKIGGLADIVISRSVLMFMTGVSMEISSLVLSAGTGLYNKIIKLATGFLMENPKDWMGGTAWGTIKNVNSGFVAIGLSLITVFWLIAYYEETVDFRSELRLEKIVVSFIKLSVAQWFVVYAIDIVGAMFSLVGDLLPDFAKTPTVDVSYVTNALLTFKTRSDVTVLSYAVMCVCSCMAVIFVVVMIIMGVLILKESFVRFFKVLVVVPYGALASSTIAGNRSIASSAVSFYKYALSCVLEAVTMILSITLYSGTISGMNNYMASGANALGEKVDAASATAEQLAMSVGGNLLIHIVLTLVLYSLIKKAHEITQRALGL